MRALVLLCGLLCACGDWTDESRNPSECWVDVKLIRSVGVRNERLHHEQRSGPCYVDVRGDTTVIVRGIRPEVSK